MASKTVLYIGGYTQSPEQGVVVYYFNNEDGTLTYRSTAEGGANPSFLAVHPSKKYLYAVNEVSSFEGERSGAISAYSIDPQSGDLTFLNQQPSWGMSPCHVSVDQTGKMVYLANYSSGSVAAYPIMADGTLAPATAKVQHEGSGPNPRRQEGPHAHSFNLNPDNKLAYVADLGMDKLMIYKLDLVNGTLEPNVVPFVTVAPGSGPRHFTFHPNKKFAYLINEMGNTITAFAVDNVTGDLQTLQTVPSLPAGWEGRNSTADIHIEPTGKFLYGSNRGHDSIVTYAIDPESGLLTYIAHTPTGGKTPRNFAIDPTGRYLLAANQDSNNVVVFTLDADTGALTPTGIEISVPKPVCLKFILLGD